MFAEIKEMCKAVLKQNQPGRRAPLPTPPLPFPDDGFACNPSTLVLALAAHGWSSHPGKGQAEAKLEHREKGNHYPLQQGTMGAPSKWSKMQSPSPLPIIQAKTSDKSNSANTSH